MSKSRRVLGIDPGLSGAVATIDLATGAASATVVPVFRASRAGKRHISEYDVAGMRAMLAGDGVALVVIEKVASMPKQGIASAFKFGVGYGIWLGLLGALGLPYVEVQAQNWKRKVLVGMPKGEKNASVRFARRMFPAVSLLATPKSTVSHDGIADALCLAEWGRRYLNTNG